MGASTAQHGLCQCVKPWQDCWWHQGKVLLQASFCSIQSAACSLTWSFEAFHTGLIAQDGGSVSLLYIWILQCCLRCSLCGSCTQVCLFTTLPASIWSVNSTSAPSVVHGLYSWFVHWLIVVTLLTRHRDGTLSTCNRVVLARKGALHQPGCIWLLQIAFQDSHELFLTQTQAVLLQVCCMPQGIFCCAQAPASLCH